MKVSNVNLAGKSQTDLIRMLRNATERSQDPRSIELKKAIFEVFEERLAQERVVDLDEQGILSAFGYRVGHSGERDSVVRRQLLELIYGASLPPILSTNYVRQWGKPKSRQRKSKMIAVLSSLIKGCESRKRTKKSYGLAASDWRTDLAFVSSFEPTSTSFEKLFAQA